MLAFDSTPPASLVFPGLTAQTTEIGAGTAKCDLILSVKDTMQGLAGSMEYSTDLWDPATIRRMLGHFETLPAGIAADPGQTLSALPLLIYHPKSAPFWPWTDGHHGPVPVIPGQNGASSSTLKDGTAIETGSLRALRNGGEPQGMVAVDETRRRGRQRGPIYVGSSCR